MVRDNSVSIMEGTDEGKPSLELNTLIHKKDINS